MLWNGADFSLPGVPVVLVVSLLMALLLFAWTRNPTTAQLGLIRAQAGDNLVASPSPQFSSLISLPLVNSNSSVFLSPPPPRDKLEWQALVERRTWEDTPQDDPSLRTNAQRGIAPQPDEPFTLCKNSPAFSSYDSPAWSGLTAKLLAANCSYSGSRHARRSTLTLPHRNASVYIVYVMSAPFVNTGVGPLLPPPYESYGQRAVRRALVRHTLAELRRQFGEEALELTVVQLDDGPLDEERDFGGAGVVNTLITATWREGQDWGMYQDGLHVAWDRLGLFEWALVMNDQMIGPVAHLPDTLALASQAGAAMWVTSSMRGCCVRGFALGFSRGLMATESWRTYWERIAFPCGKWGPMNLGETGVTLYMGWHHLFGGCVASSAGTIGKGFDLALQRKEAPTTAFIYRWGIEKEFIPNLGRNTTEAGAAPGIATALLWLQSTRVAAVVEDCSVDGSGPRVSRAEMAPHSGNSSATPRQLQQHLALFYPPPVDAVT